MKENLIKFSIIVPVYNVENFVQQCIESILAQSYTEFELIVIDDGSTDSSGFICEKAAEEDNRIRVIHQKNAGLSAARNTGMKYMTGQYVIFIDSDDFLNNNLFLYNIAAKLQKENVDILQLSYSNCDENGKNIVRGVSECKDDFSNNTDVGNVLGKLLKTNQFVISAWSKVVSTELINKHGITFKEGVLSEDIDWGYNLFTNATTMTQLNEYGYVYRKRSNSISHTIKYSHLEDIADMIYDWTNTIENMDLSSSFKYSLFGFLSYEYYICLGLSRCFSAKESRQMIERLRPLKKLVYYDINYKTKLCKWVYITLGINIASRVYNMYIISK